MEKVFRTSAPPKTTRQSLELHAARNEYVAGQLVIRAGEKTLSDVTISVSDLTSKNGNTIESKQFSLYRVAYVFLNAHNKDYPDPLPPLIKPLTVKPHENQPVWVSTTISKETKPGLYTGSITVTFDDGRKESVPVRLVVWNFTLPDDPILRNSFSFYGFTPELEGVEPGTDEHQALTVRYFEHLLERRISPNTIPYPLDSPSAAKYLSDPRMSTFRLCDQPWAYGAGGDWGRNDKLLKNRKLLTVLVQPDIEF